MSTARLRNRPDADGKAKSGSGIQKSRRPPAEHPESCSGQRHVWNRAENRPHTRRPLATRRVHFAGLTANPDEAWILQVARNATDAEDGFLRGKKYLLMDRDRKFSEAFRATLEQGGVEAVRLLPRSPNLSPHIERFMRGAKEECLGRMIFFGEQVLQAAASSFVERFPAERSHQGVDDRLIEPDEEAERTIGEVVCRERLGGLLRYYYREAA